MILADYLINGQQLTGEHSSLIVGTTHFTNISPRIDSVTVNGRNGMMLPAGPVAFDAPEITLKFITDGPDADTLMHRFYRLCRLASSLTRVERDTSTGLTRRMTANAVCTSCQPDGDEIPWNDHRAATAVFKLPDVFWRGVQWQEATLAASGGRLLPGGVSKPSGKGYWTRWQGLPNAGPSELFDIMPEGWLSNAPIGMLVLRFGAATGVTIADPVSGTNLVWGGQRDASRPYLFIDVANRKAWMAANADAWSGGTDASNGVDWTTEPLQVWPAIDSGDYRLDIRQTGGTDKVACRFLQSWE
ncbi:hypothetical protein [Bifidobacterium breve]|jgi:hypothetical protein|uniref:Uncharacterized protein n=1 Tax=Bifidobacterium breve TaxID=1685 RepID=A0AAX3NIK6_BIFBR|nr:hypothetical protein [Bifidobacterium breve]WEB54179.1 hypothetical protein PUW55_08185 [Bifidobacterium breve]